MQLSKKYTVLALLFAQTCLLGQAIEVTEVLNANRKLIILPRIDPDNEQFKKQAEQSVSRFDTAHYMRYALVPAAAIIAYASYQNFKSKSSLLRSGLSMFGNAGKSTWNGIATVVNFVPERFGLQFITPYAWPKASDKSKIGYSEPMLNVDERKSVRSLLNNWSFYAFVGSTVEAALRGTMIRAAYYAYSHSFDGGAQNLKLYVDQETSLAEIRFYLRDWQADMQEVLAESSVDSLYDTLYEYDKNVIADAEKIIAFISSLKEYAHMQNADAIDRKIKMLIDETNLFAANAERMLNEQQTQQEDDRLLTLGKLMNRTLTFIALLNREVLSFMRVHQKPAQN